MSRTLKSALLAVTILVTGSIASAQFSNGRLRDAFGNDDIDVQRFFSTLLTSNDTGVYMSHTAMVSVGAFGDLHEMVFCGVSVAEGMIWQDELETAVYLGLRLAGIEAFTPPHYSLDTVRRTSVGVWIAVQRGETSIDFGATQVQLEYTIHAGTGDFDLQASTEPVDERFVGRIEGHQTTGVTLQLGTTVGDVSVYEDCKVHSGISRWNHEALPEFTGHSRVDLAEGWLRARLVDEGPGYVDEEVIVDVEFDAVSRWLVRIPTRVALQPVAVTDATAPTNSPVSIASATFTR